MAKKILEDSLDDQETEVDDKLIEEFSSKLEITINKVLQKHQDIDPRLELLITLGSFCTQVAMDSGFDRNEFSKFMEDMFDDYSSEEEDDENKNDKETDKSNLN